MNDKNNSSNIVVTDNGLIPGVGILTTTPRKDWPAYNLNTENVLFNGQKTKYQVIMKNGKFVNFLTKAYKVLPNEDVIKTADEVAARLGGSPATMDQANKWFKADGHVAYSPDGHRMSAFYEFDKPVDITGRGDNVQKGFGISNGIDGSMGLRVFPTDVRSKCNNIMMHLYSQLSLSDGNFEHIELDLSNDVLAAGMKNLKAAQADWNELSPTVRTKLPDNKNKAFYSMRHSRGLDIDVIVKAVTDMKKVADRVMNRYREMVDLKLQVAQAQKIVASLPKVVTNKLDFIGVKDNKLILTKEVSEWKAYNDVTELLTFGKLTFRSTLENYRALDQILVSVA